jgi:uncharacterized membrane protein YozB (DUF420 family)
VWNIFVYFSKHSLLGDSPLAFYFEGGHASLFFSMLNDWSILSSLFIPMIPLSFLQDYRKRKLFEHWSIYFWSMDGMFCVTPGVGVSMYMWVYVISIMET